jgi:hypothetical protein
MDESYLIAPRMHGNTADLPTALASIIGPAGVETRVDHRDPGWLGAWLQDRCRRGLDLPEVERLCRRIYYRIDGIPMALPAQLSRATLAALFNELARLGWIPTVGIEQIARDPEHWRNLLTPDCRRVGPVYNQALREAAFAFGRLRPRFVQV